MWSKVVTDLPIDAASCYHVGVRRIELETDDVLWSLQKQLKRRETSTVTTYLCLAI